MQFLAPNGFPLQSSVIILEAGTPGNMVAQEKANEPEAAATVRHPSLPLPARKFGVKFLQHLFASSRAVDDGKVHRTSALI